MLQVKRPRYDELKETLQLLLVFREEFSDIYPEADIGKVAVTIQHHYGYNAGAGSYTAFLPEGYSQIHVYRGDVGTTRSSTSAEEIRTYQN